MYLIELGPVVYEPKGGGTFTLPQALSELRGVRGARILRADDLTVAVLDAGDIAHLTHVRRDGRQTTVARWRRWRPALVIPADSPDFDRASARAATRT
jgi:hypothetical protein